MLKHLHGASPKDYPVYLRYHQKLKKNKPIICHCRVVCVSAGVGDGPVKEDGVEWRVEVGGE